MGKKTKTQKLMPDSGDMRSESFRASKTRPKYEPPKVVTYQEDEILKQMGPVGGCVVSPGYDPYGDG